MQPLELQRTLYTVQEVAYLLSISRSFAYNLIRDGTLPSLKVGGRIRVDKDELERWIKDRTTGGATDDG